MRLKVLFLTVVAATMLLPMLVNAQTDRRDLTGFEDDIRFPSLPYYSYGQGLGLTTPDSTFRFNIRFRMQNRASFQSFSDDDREDEVEAAIRRLRLRFDGFVGDPRFLYAIQLSFAPGDVGSISSGQNLNVIRDGVFFYRPNNYWNFGFGQTKLPGNRQRVNSSGALQLTDRTINNARFTIDRDFGVFVNYSRNRASGFDWNLRGAVSTGDGRNQTGKGDANLAYTGRIELFPLGAFMSNGTMFEGDLAREETPKILLAGTYHFNQGAQRSQGQTGSSLFEQRDLTSILLDFMLKYRGWAFQSAWMTRMADDPVTENPADPQQTRHVFAGNGYDVQLSYIFPSNYEIIGRYSVQNPDREIRAFEPDQQQYSLGLTRYIWEHALKIQAEINWNRYEHRQGTESSDLYVRFQVEIGI